ncbi:hypothetical protein RB213_005704 [Colletotrichum asianum]
MDTQLDASLFLSFALFSFYPLSVLFLPRPPRSSTYQQLPLHAVIHLIATHVWVGTYSALCWPPCHPSGTCKPQIH